VLQETLPGVVSHYCNMVLNILEPEELSTTCSPKRELTQHDIGTLKQQLQEIKEQVRIFFSLFAQTNPPSRNQA
jgi:ATP-dependent 26S proteasome regulatory subunit